MAERTQRQMWVRQARAGDRRAVSLLLATYHAQLRACAIGRMGEILQAAVEPEDVLQQVYLDVIRQIDRFEGDDADTFLNWVLTILDHRIVDLRRALDRQVHTVGPPRPPAAGGGAASCYDLLEQLYAHSGTPSRVIRRDEVVGALLASMSRLSDTHRAVIQLRFLKGLSVMETAKRLQKTEAAVVALTGRALDELRKRMDALGEFTRIQ